MVEITTSPAGAALLDLYPQLQALATIPGFVAAVADDHWLDDVAPYLRIADLVEGEDLHWAKLVQAIPDAAPLDLPIPPGGENPAFLYRRLTRRAAIRTIAVAAKVGKQTFDAHPLFGGDANLKLTPANGLQCRIGRASDTSWKPSPSGVTQLMTILGDQKSLLAVEQVIFPLLGAGEQYDEAFLLWSGLAPLREWESSRRLPLTGNRALIDATPAGYEQRYSAKELSPAGIPLAVAAKLASPYAAPIVRELRQSFGSSVTDAETLIGWAASRCSIAG